MKTTRQVNHKIDMFGNALNQAIETPEYKLNN
jgi:hypothetical protein